MIAVSLFTLATSRNWAFNPASSIFITILTIIIGITLIDISSLKGVLEFNLFVASLEGIMYLVYCLFKIGKVPGAE